MDERDLHYDAVQFYNGEAELLDDRDLVAWLDLLTEDVEYRIPIRLTRESDAELSEFSERGSYFDEDRSRLEKRVERFQTDYAWSEDPPSVTRRFVTNVRIEDMPTEDGEDDGPGGDDGEEYHLKNNVLVYRKLGGDRQSDHVISGERRDVLRRVDGELKLADREVRIDRTTPLDRMSIFL